MIRFRVRSANDIRLPQRGNSPAKLEKYQGQSHLRADLATNALWASSPFYMEGELRQSGMPVFVLLCKKPQFLAWARKQTQVISLVFALNAVASILAWRGEAPQALTYADDLLALSVEHGLTNWYSFGQLIHGQTLALLGKAEQAVAETKSALDSLAATGAMIPGWAYADLAISYVTAELPEQGLQITVKGLNTADHSNNAYLHTLHGKLLLMRDSANSSDAERSFRAAIATASEQRAKYAELVATISLARLLRDTGRGDEARTMLTEIYNWFTEGFDTADVKEAKALIDELDG